MGQLKPTDRADVVRYVRTSLGAVLARDALYPDNADATKDNSVLIAECVALLRSLLSADPAADKQAQTDMGAEHNARADQGSALERARVVGVLDAWAAKMHRDVPSPECWVKGDELRWVMYLETDGPGLRWEEPTQDAARAAAAKAIESGEV